MSSKDRISSDRGGSSDVEVDVMAVDDGVANSPDPEGDLEHNAEIIRKCSELFKAPDYIMEPGIGSTLKEYFMAGGNPEEVIRSLSSGYAGVAQMANLMAEWLILSGATIQDVQNIVEKHLESIILKIFDPKKVDVIFTADEAENPSWLMEMVEHTTWRKVIYKLAEEYPDCILLNFTIKLISDAGYEGEITTVSTAAQQSEVFSRILKTAISNCLQSKGDEGEKYLAEFRKLVCHSQHTYIFTMCLLHRLYSEGKHCKVLKRLEQEISSAASKFNNVAPIVMATIGHQSEGHIRAKQHMSSMLARGALNPADITQLHKAYISPDPPPLEILRIPQFLDLLLDALFNPASKVNPEHRPKYVYLLAYAAAVPHTTQKRSGQRSTNYKEELDSTLQAVEKAQAICSANKPSNEILVDLTMMFQHLRYPVVAMGVLLWIEILTTEASYFKLAVDSTPIHLVLLDEMVGLHASLQNRALKLLTKLFETELEDFEILAMMEVKKMLIDRMVHLMTKGCVLPVISYMTSCWRSQNVDVSLIRYFVTEVLEVIAPPYSQEFIESFLPLVDNEEITGSMRENEEAIGQFLVKTQRP
ncbi:unnamed protein product [Cyprideis torosa]|uniref:Uncharacterized protein n=1 Tax=Cyprideis torosa TaxID=163714 RepID=A0A7R8WE26_9CRUS|nr:unnamed protein product [Cyprideis torosa]CAG0895279.1 unnamed protein product [Cyprideis torosa]